MILVDAALQLLESGGKLERKWLMVLWWCLNLCTHWINCLWTRSILSSNLPQHWHNIDIFTFCCKMSHSIEVALFLCQSKLLLWPMVKWWEDFQPIIFYCKLVFWFGRSYCSVEIYIQWSYHKNLFCFWTSSKAHLSLSWKLNLGILRRTLVHTLPENYIYSRYFNFYITIVLLLNCFK